VVARPYRLTRRAALVALALLAGCATVPQRSGLATADTVLTTPTGRAVKYRVVWPEGAQRPLPVLLLSHGANGTLDGLANLQRGLARGRIVIAPQHVDSEANPDLAKVDRTTTFPLRIEDMRLPLEQAAKIETVTGARIDMGRIAAGGHSYGALIAQALGGAEVGVQGSSNRTWTDARVTRVLAISPPGPFGNLFTAEGWSKMTVPQFVATGTADVVPMLAPKWEAHMVSFDAGRVSGSALWVGRGVDHYFGNKVQRLTRDAPDQSAGFALALDLSNAFLEGRPLKAKPDAVTERLTVK
jgi:predicted dienelactone hydrolase